MKEPRNYFRWLERADGSKVLQQQWAQMNNWAARDIEWRDVPTVKES